jgi:UDP-3-O-[3-hydroxymyristoyl] glucosamine N-acyltransferase
MTLYEIIEKTTAKIYNPKKINLKKKIIRNIASLENAEEDDLVFLFDQNKKRHLSTSKASVFCLKNIEPSLHTTQIIHPDPIEVMSILSKEMHPSPCFNENFSGKYYVSNKAKVDPSAIIYPYAYIDEHAIIGKNVTIYPHTYIGSYCKIGSNSIIHSNTSIISYCIIGQHVIINPNCVIGGDGFGFIPTEQGTKKIPQTGNVIIEDHVEIGAGTTIDRATFDSTIIKKGAKLDSQVHIGHNTQIGRHSIICGQVGIAGSSKIGDFCLLGGQVGIIPGITIGDKVKLAARAGIIEDKESNSSYAGFPAINSIQWKKQTILTKRLPQLAKRIKELEEKLSKLETIIKNNNL